MVDDIALLLARESWNRRTSDEGRWVTYQCEVPVISRGWWDTPRRRIATGYVWVSERAIPRTHVP